MSEQIEWVGVDWGTSNVRAWGLDAAGEIVAFAQSEQGMNRLTPDQYLGVLGELMADFQLPNEKTIQKTIDVVVCGMAGAKQGWHEAPYLQTPAELTSLGINAVTPTPDTTDMRVRILSGVCQSQHGNEDVMRGEETQILGIVAQEPNFSGMVCMPGTHSKWVTIDGGNIIKFSTAMTGELFELLRDKSVLRHTMPQDVDVQRSKTGFAAGLTQGLNAPELLTSNIFKARAANLLSDRTPDWCYGYLSGLLIGSEIAVHTKELKGEPVQIVGSGPLCALYADAMKQLSINSVLVDATQATLTGLSQARKHIRYG